MRLSLGTAGRLGLSRVRQTDPPTTAYLLLEGRCAANCAFCPQAREAHCRADQLSRVTWPEFPDAEILAALAAEQGFGRLCVQVVNAPGWRDRLDKFLASLAEVPHPPVSLSVRPGSAAEVAGWLSRGVDRVGIPLDAATPELFRRLKGGSWEETMQILTETASAFPGRVSTHLIVGLGETEREAAETLLKLYAAGVNVGLFAFTPVPGTALAGEKPPDLGTYRRLQAARWFLATGRVPADGRPFSYAGRGRIVGLGLPPTELRRVLADGEAFRTTGCPECNRPYYNERPGGTIYNYPRPLTSEEAERALAELELPAEGGQPGPGQETEPARWRRLETGYAPGAWNMAVDEALMEAVGREDSPPTLRFYGWNPPALSLGYFQDRAREVDLDGCATQGFDCVRRPTGGRAVLHSAEVTYAVVVPEGYPGFGGSVSEAYRAIAEGLLVGLKRLGVPAEMAEAPRREGGERSAACFDSPSFYELVVDGRKLVGSAQVRRHGAILQHGSILLRFDPLELLRCLAVPAGPGRERLQRALTGHVVSLAEALGREPGFAEVAEAVAGGMAEVFGVALEPGGLTAGESTRAEELARLKYASEAWNGRRPGAGEARG